MFHLAGRRWFALIVGVGLLCSLPGIALSAASLSSLSQSGSAPNDKIDAPAFSLHLPLVTQTTASDKDFIAVATGLAHTCAVSADGGAYCWGSNYNGQLGTNTGNSESQPTGVVGLSSNVKSIGANDNYSCALLINGTVQCWGNYFFETGLGTKTPLPVTELTAEVTAIAVGGYQSCALSVTGGVECWLSLDLVAQAVDGLSQDVSAISAHSDYLCALMEDGTVRCLGTYYDQEGNLRGTQTPTEVAGLNGEAKAIAVGQARVCVLLESGAIQCWGRNDFGQLGDGSTTDREMPVNVQGLGDKATSLVSGASHNCALLVNTEVKCWGMNGSSQLGDGNTTHRTTAVKVEGLDGKVTQLAAGVEHTCVLLESGTIQCWGYAADGRIGDGTSEARTTPMAIPGLSSGVDAIAVGAVHGCALVQGDVKCFGINYANQVGTSNGLQPRAIVVPGLTLKATAIGAGDFHSCAALSDGTVSCWGDPGGTSPTKVEGLDEAVVSLSLGYSFACGLYSTTGVECWGNSDQLPDPPNFFTSGVVQVSTGRDHGCALLEDSVVKCWSGWSDIRVPFTVTGFAGEVQSIAAGEGDSCALLVGGTVQCWDTFTSSTSSPYVPTTVNGFAGTVTGIDVGRDHACALLEGGIVQCWGSNLSGQLGTGDIAPRTQPTTVIGLSNVQAISAGELITCALLQGGTVQCWGSTKALDAIRFTPANVLWD